jgi:hypothetical protein
MTLALRLIWLAALAAVIVGSVLSAQSAATRLIALGDHTTFIAALSSHPACPRTGATWRPSRG